MNDRDIYVDNPLALSWCDRRFISGLCYDNVLEYFAQRSNPFYDHTSNNEMLNMRGIKITNEALEKMVGLEYVVLHVLEPILFVIRKQKRLSPTDTRPIAHYYIIAGIIYQAPDMQSIIHSKLVTSIHHLQSAFDECFGYARFHPSTDYYWDFAKDGTTSLSANSDDQKSSSKPDGKGGKKSSDQDKKKEISIAEANDTARHMYRVDVLLHELMKKFPLKPPPSNPAITNNSNNGGSGDTKPNENGENNSNTGENGASKVPNGSTTGNEPNSAGQSETLATTTTTTTTNTTTNTASASASASAASNQIKIEPEDDYKSSSNQKLGPNPSKKTKFN